MKEIVDHKYDAPEGSVYGDNKQKRQRYTIDGWYLCCEWKDGSTNWVAFKDIKDAYAVQVAEYAVINNLQDQPAFSWWVPYVMKKRKQIISKIKSKYWSRTHKYGIRIPKSVKEALEIDEQEGNHYWRDTIMEKMKKITGCGDGL